MIFADFAKHTNNHHRYHYPTHELKRNVRSQHNHEQETIRKHMMEHMDAQV